MSDTIDSIHNLLAEAVRRDVEPWPDSAELADIPGMDSLANLRLIAAIEERLGAKLEIDALLALEKVGDVRALLHSTA